MKTKTINLYEFSELSEQAKQNALDNLRDLNTDYDWYTDLYYDAKQIGLKIDGFTEHKCKGRLILDFEEVVSLILANHGPDTTTFKTAKQANEAKAQLVSKYSNGTDKVTEENESDFDADMDELEYEFKNALCEDYRILLNNEYEYLSSDTAIIETIESNGYTFTENGKLENA